MFKDRLVILGYILFLLLSSVLVINPENGIACSKSTLDTDGIREIPSYTPGDPILIQSDADFETQGWSGNGSLENPYIVEDLEIETEHLCLRIVDTSVHFVIQNCQFVASIEASGAKAISFENVSHGIVKQCNMTGNIGMYLFDSRDLNVSMNIFHTFSPIDSYGLRIIESMRCNISNNQFFGDGTGLKLIMSDNCSITNNEFNGCGFDFLEIDIPITPGGHGLIFTDNIVNDKMLQIYEVLTNANLNGSNYGQIWLFDCYNVSIMGGVFVRATRGIVFTNCGNCSIIGSSISDCALTGIKFKECIGCRIIDCIIEWNGKLKPVYVEAGGIFIDGYSECALLNSNISFNYGHGLYLNGVQQCTVNASVFRSNGGLSFNLALCSNCEIHNNIFIDDGLLITGSLTQSIHSISNNTVNGKPLGYFANLSDTSILGSDFGAIILVNSSKVDIYNGDFSCAFHGIQIEYSNDCEVRNFTITGNEGYGIRLSYSYLCRIKSCIIKGGFQYGLSLFESNNCSTEDTIVHGCVRGLGIGLSNNTITRCILAYNDLTNLILGGSSSNNYIFGNRLGWADDSAIDNGAGNHFDDGISIGNYWSDYDGVGFYAVSGPAGSVDHYPAVLTATSPPTISTPSSITFEVGSTGNSLEWIVQALYNATFVVLKNESIIREGDVSATPIVVQLDGLQVGMYIYTTIVTDIFGEVTSNSVLVTVIEESATTTTTYTNTAPYEFDPTLVTLLVSGVIGVIILIIIFLKAKPR